MYDILQDDDDDVVTIDDDEPSCSTFNSNEHAYSYSKCCLFNGNKFSQCNLCLYTWYFF